jgi:hypothetical protein
MMTDRQATASLFLMKQQIAAMEKQLTLMAITASNLYDNTEYRSDAQEQVVRVNARIQAMLRAARGT